MRNRLLPGVGAMTRLQRWLAVGLLALIVLPGCLNADKDVSQPPPQTGARGKSDDTDEAKGFWTYFDGWDVDANPRDWTWFGLRKLDEPPPPPAETVVLRGDGLEAAKPPAAGTPAARLAGAHEWLREGKYDMAEGVFRRLADHSKTPVRIAEEARFYQAECLRLQKKYPEAGDTYVDLMNKFPSNPFREQAVQHMFDIANYWLEDTREQRREQEEVDGGKRWFVSPNFLHPFEPSKPFLDEEGRAIEMLEKVYLGDIGCPQTGGLADKALFLCGRVKFDELKFLEADYYFSQLCERYPKSPYAAQAVQLGIVAKNNATGGPDFDGRKSAEARILVQTALNSYPEIANDPEKQEKLMGQLASISLQQAEKDYRMAEFWAWTGHPASAYFYFEMVRRRYPGTELAKKATERMDNLRIAAEKEQNQPAKGLELPFFGTGAAASSAGPTAPAVLPLDIQH